MRQLTAGLHQRLHTYLVSVCHVHVDNVKKWSSEIIRFSWDNSHGIFLVDKVHLMLGERRGFRDQVELVPASFVELERLFRRALTVLGIVHPDMFGAPVVSAFVT